MMMMMMMMMTMMMRMLQMMIDENGSIQIGFAGADKE